LNHRQSSEYAIGSYDCTVESGIDYYYDY